MEIEILNKIPDIDWKEPIPAIDTEEFRKVVMSRRSVRVYDETPIPEAVVQDCINMGLLAPNSSNLQCWSFYWVHTPEKKKKLAEACLNQPAARTAQELIVCVARPRGWKMTRQLMLKEFEKQGPKVPQGAIDYYAKLVPMMYSMGFLNVAGIVKKVILFFRGLSKPTPREPTTHKELEIWAVKSSSLACQNIMLAFRAHGFDSCPMEGFDSTRVKKLLDLPKEDVITMVISAGKRAPNGVYGPRIRFDRKLFVQKI